MKNIKKTFFLFYFLLLFLAFPAVLWGQGGKDLEVIRDTNKVALVMGNFDYRNGFSKLSSPGNDASKMAEALKRLGFRLVGGKAHVNTTFQQMEDLLDRLTYELKDGGVGFFYFSGHGSQNNYKENFLVPVDTPIKFKSDLKYMALNVEFVTSRMEETKNRLNILVLDACRNNPLPSGSKSGDKGLNTSGAVPSGVYIAFAARDGQTAADGDTDGLSLYTGELLKHMEIPNERLEDIFIKTRVSVKQQTQNAQFPIDYGSLDGVFYFKVNQAFVNRDTAVNWYKPERAEDFFKLGLDCLSSDYDCAISKYSRAIQLNPNYAQAFNNRGNAFVDKKDYDSAIRDYYKAIDLNPGFAVAYYNLGHAYYIQQNYDYAIQNFDRAIKLKPDFTWAYYNRGCAYADMKNYEQAIRNYSRAIELDSYNPVFYKNRAAAYQSVGESAKAEADEKKAADLEKNLKKLPAR